MSVAFIISLISLRVSFSNANGVTMIEKSYWSLMLLVGSTIDGLIFASIWWLFSQARIANPDRIADALTFCMPSTLAYSSLLLIIFRASPIATVDFKVPRAYVATVVMLGLISVFVLKFRSDADRFRNRRYWLLLTVVSLSAFYLGLSLSPSDLLFFLPLGFVTWLIGLFRPDGKILSIVILVLSCFSTISYFGAQFVKGYVLGSGTQVFNYIESVMLAIGLVVSSVIFSVVKSQNCKDGVSKSHFKYSFKNQSIRNRKV